MIPDTLYEFLYCSCIHESGSATMSLHRTKEGAERAMEAHKAERQKEWDERAARWAKEGSSLARTDLEDMESWHVAAIQLLD